MNMRSSGNKKGIILLSGGLDSLVALDIARRNTDVKLALTFNYGQKAYEQEVNAAKDICRHYNIEHKVIKLPYLEEISDNALVNRDNNDFNNLKSVWIPNRNGLFLNIAACYADKFGYDCIIFGANKQEAADFPDNSEEYVKICNLFFKYSTLKQVQVLAPTLQFDKIKIINYAIDYQLPLNMIKSCYKNTDTKKHCGECMSCKLLYNAILKSKKPELIKEIF